MTLRNMLRSTRIKICGIRTAEAARACAESGADLVGFVFVEGSPRHVTLDVARAIVADLPDTLEPVGLFVDADVEEIRRVAQLVGLRTVQLHGGETAEYVRALAPLRVIKSLPVAGDFDRSLDAWRQRRGTLLDNLAALLLDAPPAEHAGRVTGGSGRTFDWSDLAELDREDLPPIFVAGGLTPENVGDAVARLAPDGVDVSSGVEATRGHKSVEKIRAFCEAVRHADAR